MENLHVSLYYFWPQWKVLFENIKTYSYFIHQQLISIAEWDKKYCGTWQSSRHSPRNSGDATSCRRSAGVASSKCRATPPPPPALRDRGRPHPPDARFNTTLSTHLWDINNSSNIDSWKSNQFELCSWYLIFALNCMDSCVSNDTIWPSVPLPPHQSQTVGRRLS